MNEIELTICGRVVVKKNLYKQGRGHWYKPKGVVSYIDSAILQIKMQRGKKHIEIYEKDVSVYLLFERAKRDADLDGMTTTIYDILQQAKIIKNDSQIVHSEQFKTKAADDLTRVYIKEYEE